MITIETHQKIVELQRIDNIIEQKKEIYELLTGKDPSEMIMAEFLNEYRKEIAKIEIPNPHEFEPITKLKVGNRTFTPLIEYAKWEAWRFISYWEVCKKEDDNISLQMAIMTEEKKGEKLSANEILEKADFFYKNADFKTAVTLGFFLLNHYKRLFSRIQAYSQAETETENRIPFPSAGDGM
jgi:hypothetical protein